MSNCVTPLISVIIPTCHRNDLLALCLDCLAPGIQTLPPEQYEVIVTDDGARSTAQQMVQERYPWAKWVAGPRRGPAANRNHGASEALGEWLAFTDDDCLPLPGWLEGYVQALDAGVSVYEGKTVSKAVNSPLYSAPINLNGGNFWSCNFMIAQSVFREMGGFDEKFTMAAGEDTDLRERLRKRNEKLLFTQAAVVDHPPQRQPSGWRLGEKYGANVQHWYKVGNRGSYWILYLKHIKHRLHCLRQFQLSWDLIIAYNSLSVEILYVIFHLPRWQKQFSSIYDSYVPSAPDVRPSL